MLMGVVLAAGAVEPTVRSVEPVDVETAYYPGAKPFKNAEKLHFFTSASYNGGVVLQLYTASDHNASAGETIGLNSRMSGTNELVVDMKQEFDKVHEQGLYPNCGPSDWYHFCKLWVDTAGNIKTLSATGEFLQTSAEAMRLEVETGNDLHICRAEKPDERPYITVKNPSDQSLHWTATFTVSDIFGRRYAIPFDRTVAAGETVRVDFPWGEGQLPPAKGVWYVHAEIDGDDGSHDMRQTSFAWIDLHEKTPDMPNSKFRFGIHYHGTKYLPGQTNITLQALVAVGAKAMRTDYSFMFGDICPTRDVFDADPANWKWEKADAMLGAIRAAGLSADIIIASTPDWARDPNGAWATAPEDKRTRSGVWATAPGLFRTFCQEFAARYTDQIDYYEVGNEWNLSTPEELTGEEALRMQQEAYDGLHAGYANACVTPNGWSTTGTWSQHLETADRNPTLGPKISENPSCFDMWATHIYRDFTGFADAVDRHLLPMLNTLPEGKRRWINTENGISSVDGQEMKQAETIWKKMLFAWNRGASGFNWYNLKATGYFNGSEPGFGLVTADFHPRAGYASFAALSAIFQGLDSDGEITSEGDRHILRFKGTNWKNDFTGIVLAGWDKTCGRSEAIATDATKAELSDHMGNRTELPISGGVVTFPVSTKPQALILTDATTATQTTLATPPTVASGFTGKTWNVGPSDNVQAVLNGAAAGDVIEFAAGTYSGDAKETQLGGVNSLSRLVVDKKLYLKGAGRDATTIRGGEGIRCLLLTENAAGSLVEGLTLAGGRTVAADARLGTDDYAARCFVKNGDGSYSKVGKYGVNIAACGGGVYFTGGAGEAYFVDVTIDDCAAGYAGGAVCGNVTLIRTLVRNCRATLLYGGAVQGSPGAFSSVFIGNGGNPGYELEPFSTVLGYVEGDGPVTWVNCTEVVNFGEGLAQHADPATATREYAGKFRFANCAFFDRSSCRFVSQASEVWNSAMNANGSMPNNHDNIGGDWGANWPNERHFSGGNTATNSKFGWEQFVCVYDDWHLRDESMMLDAGDKGFVDSHAAFVPSEYRDKDFWGDARVQNGEIDIGACEGARTKGGNLSVLSSGTVLVNGLPLATGNGIDSISGAVGDTVAIGILDVEGVAQSDIVVDGTLQASPYVWTVTAAGTATVTKEIGPVTSGGGDGGAAAAYGSVVAVWRFNESPYMEDSGLFGHHLTAFGTDVMGEAGTGNGENGYDGTSYLDLHTAGNTATGSPFSENWIDSSKGHTILLRFNTKGDLGITGYSTADAEIKRLLDHISKLNAWHTLVYRYDPDKRVNANYTDTLYTDPHFGDGYGTGFEQPSDYTQISGDHGNVFFPVTLSATGVALGGEIGGKYKTWLSTKTKKGKFKGYFDDVTVVSRVMSWQEISRFHHTGETYVYPVGSSLSFASCGGSTGWSYRQWAANGHEQNYAPAFIPGADFIVDNGWTVSADLSRFPCRSLTLGRLAPLVSRVDGVQITASTVGKIAQRVANLAVNDLRLQCGEYLPGETGERLTVAQLSVLAPEQAPFAMAVSAGRSFAVSGTAVGGGWLRMSGTGMLDLWNLTGDYKVETASGTTKCRHIDSYGGARIDVSDGEVTVTKTIRELSKFILKCARTLTAVGDYPILTVRDSLFAFEQGRGYELTSDSVIAVESDELRYGGLKVTVNGDGSKTLSIVCTQNTAEIPDEDKGPSPIVMGE